MVQKYPHGPLVMHRKVTVRGLCPEDDRGSFFDALAQAFENGEGFFTSIGDDGTVSRYELSFHDDVLEIEHQASHVAGAIVQPFEPIVFLIENENDCTVLKQMSFNKMDGGASEVMDSGEKSNNGTPPEQVSHRDASSEEPPATQNVPETRIPVMNTGDSANAINVDDLVSLLKHPSAASSDCPIIVMDEDSLPLGMPGELGGKRNVSEPESSKSSLHERRSKASSESSAGGWSVPSLQVSTSQDSADKDKPSCESEPCNYRPCMSSQAMIDSIIKRVSAPQDKGAEVDPARKNMASHDKTYAGELMKEEQNAMSEDKLSGQPSSEIKPMLVINSYLSEKKSTASLPNMEEAQASRSSVTLSEKSLNRRTAQFNPKVEYCKSADVDSVVIKITVPENSGIEVVLHKINEDDRKPSTELLGEMHSGPQKTQSDADIQTLKQVIKCTSPHSKVMEITTEQPSTSSDTVQTQSRIVSSIKERNQDLERNTTKGKVKKMVEFFEKIREQE